VVQVVALLLELMDILFQVFLTDLHLVLRTILEELTVRMHVLMEDLLQKLLHQVLK
jgi:hypothetical protein